jgi:putative PIN family toxin of toxin-antitoxin system
MRCLAVIDTNVIVSALLSSKDTAATVQIVKKVIEGEITPVFSRTILAEYREVLSRQKFSFDHEIVDYIVSFIGKFGISAEPTPSEAILPDMDDLPFYEVALETQKQSSFLVTGNKKHFPNDPFIVSPRQLLDFLNSEKT